MYSFQAADQDDDSENENLSPLLNPKSKKSQKQAKKSNSNFAGNQQQQQQPQPQQQPQQPTALQMDGVNEPIDDTESDLEHNEVSGLSTALLRVTLANFEHLPRQDSRPKGLSTNSTLNSSQGSQEAADQNTGGAEDSDYYTPEDPHTTILSPLCPDKVRRGS